MPVHCFLCRFTLDDDGPEEPAFVLSGYCATIRSLNSSLFYTALPRLPSKNNPKALQDKRVLTDSVRNPQHSRGTPCLCPLLGEARTYPVWGQAACPRTGSFFCWPPPVSWQVPGPRRTAQWPSVFPGSSLLARSSSRQDQVGGEKALHVTKHL